MVRCAACDAAVDDAHSEPVSFGSGRRCATCSRRFRALAAAMCHRPPPVTRANLDVGVGVALLVGCGVTFAAVFVFTIYWMLTL